MAEIKKVYEDAARETQFYPQTHVKAVVDDNGVNVATKIEQLTEIINQKLMEVGAVPSDLTPTKSSTNWVTSGGLFNATHGETIIDLDIYGLRNAYPSTTWQDNFTSVFIPVNAGEEYLIKANDDARLTISCLSDASYTIGSTPTTIVQKYTINAGTEGDITIPDGSQYMLIAVKGLSNNVDYTPSYVKKVSSTKDDVGEMADEIGAIRNNAAAWVEVEGTSGIPGTISRAGTWGGLDGVVGYSSGEIKVTSGLRYRVTAQSSAAASLRWLTASDTSHEQGDAAPVVESRGAVVVAAGETMILDVPTGAEYLNYIELIANSNRTPLIEEEAFGGEESTTATAARQIPKIGCGTAIVSRPADSYAHAPIILENNTYRFVIYQGSTQVTVEDGVGSTYSHIMYVCNKKTNVEKYIKVFDCADPDTIDGNTCSIYYNETAIILNGTNTVLIRTGCHLNGEWVQVYKTYDADNDVLSSAALQRLSYNGDAVNFTMANYITLLNTLYGTGLTVVSTRYTNQINNICYYNGYYYCVYALVTKSGSSSGNIVPHVFAWSTDCVTWEPIANLFSAYTSETQIAIANDKVYYVYRALSAGTYYTVFNIDGTAATEPVRLSTMASKPTIIYNGKHDKIIIGYNGVLGDSSNRIKMILAEISQSTGSVTNLKSYINANGWNYFFFYAKPNGNILSVSVEDSRQFNSGATGATTTTDVRIEEIDMFDVISGE